MHLCRTGGLADLPGSNLGEFLLLGRALRLLFKPPRPLGMPALLLLVVEGPLLLPPLFSCPFSSNEEVPELLGRALRLLFNPPRLEPAPVLGGPPFRPPLELADKSPALPRFELESIPPARLDRGVTLRLLFICPLREPSPVIGGPSFDRELLDRSPPLLRFETL